MKKKVLFIIWTFTAGGGSEKILANIINNIDEEKYEVSVLEYINFNIKNEKIKNNIKLLKPLIQYKENLKFIPSVLLKLRIRLFDFLLKYFPELLRRIASKDIYDIEVAFNYMIPTFLTLKNKNNINISWMHGSIEDLDYKDINDKQERLKAEKSNLLQEKSLKKFDKIVAISNQTYNSVLKVYPETKDKLMKIYNGFDFKSIIQKSEQPIEVNYGDKPIIIGVGRLDEKKNFELLIKSAKVLKKKKEDFKVLILGDGPEREKLEKLVKDLELEDTVSLLGFIDNPYPYMKMAYMFCLSSDAEGFPTVIAETMVLGCPFISTKVAGIEELSDNGRCGLVVERDEKSMAATMLQLLQDKKLREELSEACKDNVRKFSLERQIAQIEDLFDGIKHHSGVNR